MTAPAPVSEVLSVVANRSDIGFAVKISHKDYEINIHFLTQEIERIPSILSGNWDLRQSVRLGTSAKSPVFWVADPAEVTVLVGPDDETWDIAIGFPHTVVDQILEAIRDEAETS